MIIAKQESKKAGEEIIRVIMEDKKFGDYSGCYSKKAFINPKSYMNNICNKVVDQKLVNVILYSNIYNISYIT